MLQFRVTQLFGIMTKIHGIALASEEGIRLAFHDPHDAEGKRPMDVDISEVLITWKNLECIAFNPGLLSDRVVISVKSQEPLKGLSQMTEQQVTLETRRQDRDAMKEFEQRVTEFQAGQRRADVDGMIDDIQDFLHGL